MAVTLSPLGGVAGQFFDNNGAPLSGGLLYTYAAGTTTAQATYYDAAGVTLNANPIVLDAGGRVPNEIWLNSGLSYKFVLKTSAGVLIGSWDNITGINSNFVNYSAQEQIQTATAGQTVFTLTGGLSYTPGTNTLQVFVDGVNQYDGSSYSYTETNSTTVTFTQGLHVGALVKFTTAVTLSAGVTTSNLVSYTPAGTGAVATNVQSKLQQPTTVNVLDFIPVTEQAAILNGTSTYNCATAIQAAVAYVEGLAATMALPQPAVIFPGDALYCIQSQIVLNSDLNTMIVGFPGKPTLKWTGATMNTSTQDNSSGSMVYFSGTDHAFGGIENFFIDAQSKANFCVYLEGICQPQFRMRRLHMKHSQLDLFYMNNKTGGGQTQLIIDEITCFPATAATFSGQTAVCGRYPIHIAIGSNTGMIRIKDTGLDSGVAGCIGIVKGATATYIGEQILLDNVRFETYGSNKDVVVLDYGTGTSPGEITVLDCKPSIGDAGSIDAFIANATSPAGTRPIINFVPFTTQNTMTYIYSDVDTTKNIAFDTKRQGVVFAVNQTTSVGRLQVGTAMPTTPFDGDYYLDNSNRQLVGRVNGHTFVQPFGNPGIYGPSTTYAILYTDYDKLIHNSNAGTLGLTLPAISTVLTGFRINIAASTSGVITLTPSGSDAIYTKTAGQTFVSSGSAGDALILMAGPGSRWIVLSKLGTWS